MASQEIVNTGTKLVSVNITDLHTQYIPHFTPIEIWNHDMSVANSPHVELMRLFLQIGGGLDWSVLKETRYVKERQNRRKLGKTQWTDGYIRNVHLPRRYRILCSIRKSGFKPKKRGDKPVVVLQQPFYKTRYGWDEPFLHGMEVWDGMGAVSAAYACGAKKILVQMAEDAQPGTNQCKKFEQKLPPEVVAKIKETAHANHLP